MSPLFIIVLIVLVDLLGFTLVMPLLPRFAAHYGFSDLQIGLLLAAFPLCQLVAGPILGRLSDRYGRRPVLAISQFGTALSFLILGLSRDFPIMLLARMLDGISGGNYLVAQAYVADITRPEHRARGMGLIGAAFGVGFVLGPLLGGLVLLLPLPEAWRLRLPFLIAAAFSTLAWVLVLKFLPESIPRGSLPRESLRVFTRRGVADLLAYPAVAALVGLGALITLAFASLEGTFSLFLEKRFHWSATRAAFAFASLGLVSALIQGGLIRSLTPRFGEKRLVLAGTASLALGLFCLAHAHSWPALLAAILLVGTGSGLAGPSTLGLLSRATPGSEQGAVFGILTSAQTFARMLNYVIANRLLGQAGPAAPYLEGATIAALAFSLAFCFVARPIGVKTSSTLTDSPTGELPPTPM
jgi:DHA1 family tetracycline resistance protein-like MFS transporter